MFNTADIAFFRDLLVQRTRERAAENRKMANVLSSVMAVFSVATIALATTVSPGFYLLLIFVVVGTFATIAYWVDASEQEQFVSTMTDAVNSGRWGSDADLAALLAAVPEMRARIEVATNAAMRAAAGPWPPVPSDQDAT